jgi:hypothetical protein
MHTTPMPPLIPSPVKRPTPEDEDYVLPPHSD